MSLIAADFFNIPSLLFFQYLSWHGCTRYFLATALQLKAPVSHSRSIESLSFKLQRRRMFAGVGVIVVDCCSVEKEVMKKSGRKFMNLLSRGSGDRAACGFRPCCSKKRHLPDAISQVLERAGKNYHEQKCIFLSDLQE
jgi:hypothetical protein